MAAVAGAIRQRHHDHSPVEDHRSKSQADSVSSIFFNWVEDSLNINTELVQIQTFQYYDYVKAMKDRVDVFFDEEIQYYNSYYQTALDQNNGEDSDDDDDDDRFISVRQYPTIPTRGLAASRDIEIGQIVLQIPHSALWTISNRIDNDPILSKVLGLNQRMKYGWNSQIDEIPMLAVALLYHFQLDREVEKENGESPHWAYLQILEETNVHDRIPHLWDSKTLRRSATIGVRKVAKGIQKDVKELYDRIVVPLIQEFPDMFGNHKEQNHLTDDKSQQEDDSDDSEWMFSLERFHWAFALVNSRHWQLPIPNGEGKEDEGIVEESNGETEVDDPSLANVQFDDNASPPASMPTDEWMELQQNLEYLRDEEASELNESDEVDIDWPVGNSFLAPVADLLNFGPPCTRGVYNLSTRTFDILATCHIPMGQEITFWYADACQDIFMANYGFTMPTLVPQCQPTFDDSMTKTQFALHLEKELLLSLDELDKMDIEMERLVKLLKDCKCEKKGKENRIQHLDDTASSPVPPLHPSKKDNNKKKATKKGSQNARHAIRGTEKMTSSGSTKSDGLSRSRKRQRQRVASTGSLDL
jgi:hypothetical protein